MCNETKPEIYDGKLNCYVFRDDFLHICFARVCNSDMLSLDSTAWSCNSRKAGDRGPVSHSPFNITSLYLVSHKFSAGIKRTYPWLLKQEMLHISEADLLLEDVHSSQHSLCQASPSYLHASPPCQLFPSSPTEVIVLTTPAWSPLVPLFFLVQLTPKVTHCTVSVLVALWL